MLVFLITVLAVVILLALDRSYPNKNKEPIKYTNLDWEVIRDGYYSGYTHYYGHIYSVVKNKVVSVYKSKGFDSETKAKEYIKKIYQTMRAEYGLADVPDQSFHNVGLPNTYSNLYRR